MISLPFLSVEMLHKCFSFIEMNKEKANQSRKFKEKRNNYTKKKQKLMVNVIILIVAANSDNNESK